MRLWKCAVVAVVSLLGLFIVARTLSLLLSQLSPPPSLPQCSWLLDDKPQILAHRGSRHLAPENTLLAFRIARDLGADVLETDVSLTADSDLVLLHDTIIDRTLNGTGSVITKTVKEIQQLDAAYHYAVRKGGVVTYPERGKGNRVPTLREFLTEFKDQRINLEIKDNNMKAVEILDQQRREMEAMNRVVVSSKYCNVISRFRQLNPSVCTGACEEEATRFVMLNIFGLYTLWRTFFEHCPARVFQIPTVSAGVPLDTEHFIDTIHSMNQKVHYWVVNEATEMKKLLELGVDGIITDRVDLAVEVARELGLNKTKSVESVDYYLPEEMVVEHHTCEGSLCKLVAFLFNLELTHLLLLSALLFFLPLLLSWSLSGSTRQKIKHT